MTSIPSVLQALWLVVFFNGSPVTLDINQNLEFPMRTAWNATGETVRFVPFAATDAKLAKLLDQAAKYNNGWCVPVDWAPEMKCAFLRDVLNDVYFINCGQTIIFSTEPGEPEYTPLWRVHWLEFAPGYPVRAINTVAEVLEALASGELLLMQPYSILNATIVQNSDGLIIPQGSDFDIQERSIELPVINTFARTRFQPRPLNRYVVLTETDNQELAQQVGAYYSPRMSDLAAGCCDEVYAFIDPVTPGQLPILNYIQEYRPVDGLQINKLYNPIKCWNLFDLPDPNPMDWSLITLKSQQATDYLLAKGVIQGVGLCDPIVTNSPSYDPCCYIKNFVNH